MKRSVLEINVGMLRNNWKLIQDLVRPSKVIAVLKANGYGLGATKIAKFLIDEGADYFATALLEEAVQLRESGVVGNILMLSPYLESEIEGIYQYRLKTTIVDKFRAKLLNDYGYKHNQTIGIHLKVDTGMGRLGVRIEDVQKLLEDIQGYKNIRLEGIYTHCPSADVPDVEFTSYQIERYKRLIGGLKEQSFSFMSHMMNSGGVVHFPQGYFDRVRPGLMLYGVYSSPSMVSKVDLSAVISWKARIIDIKYLERGDGISYGRKFIVQQDRMKIGLVSVGYSDGYSTLLTSKSCVVIRRERVAVLGRIGMNYIVVDLSGVESVFIGEEVFLLGAGITVGELAEKSGLIPHEILTNLSDRLPKVYIES